MATVDVLVTKYQMDNRDYVQGAKQVDMATTSNVRHMESLSRGIMGATSVVVGFVGAVGAATTALVALGTVSVQKSAQFDAMVKALEAIEGSAKGASDAISELREIASRPGLGLEEAIQGYSGLRRAGLDREMSMRILGSAGNANALAGGGREELSRILTAITQIAMKPNLSGEELMQLNEGGIAASRIIGDAFGTFDGAELKKLGVDSRDALEALVKGMEDMPQAASSAKNSIENLQMGIDMALVGIGSGLTTHLIGPLDELGASLVRIEELGVFEMLGDALGTVITTTFPELTTTGSELDDVLTALIAKVADTAQALGNLKMNIQDMFGFWQDFASKVTPDWLEIGFRAAPDFFGELNAGQSVIDQKKTKETALAESNRLAQSEGFEDRDERREARSNGFFTKAAWDAYKASQGTQDPANPDKDPFGAPSMQVKYLMEIERNTSVTAKAMQAFSLGQSITGENVFNPVNINRFNGGRVNGSVGGRIGDAIEEYILELITSNNRTVGF